MSNERKQLPRDCCPICGYQFDEVQEWNECPSIADRGGHGMGDLEHGAPTRNHFHRDELITEDDDYAWVE